MQEGKRPTIADVARAAGVAPSTVSNSLNGRGYVDAKTRERIQEIAKDLGYRPNLRAQRLRVGSARAFGLVASMPSSIAAGPSRLGFFMEVAAAAAETALTHGFAMILIPPLEQHPRLDQFDIDGAIVVEPEEDDAVTAQLSAIGVPLVSIGRQPGAEEAFPFVDMHAGEAGRLLLDHLYQQGSRKIALIVGAQHRHSYLDVAEAYHSFVAEHGMEAIVASVDEPDGEEGGRMAILRILEAHPDLDGVCAIVDAFAVGAVRGLKESGRRIPHDVRVVTRYDGLRAQTCQPPLTALNLNLGTVADLAVSLLLEHKSGDRTRHMVSGPPPLLVPRASSMSVEQHDHA